MNKKGFTLIELLAVIVILAIIALITAPIILGVIEGARKDAAKDKAWGTINAVELAYTQDQIKDASYQIGTPVTFSNNKASVGTTEVKASGELPESGTVTIREDGSIIAQNLKFKDYTCSTIKSETNTEPDPNNMVCVKDGATQTPTIPKDGIVYAWPTNLLNFKDSIEGIEVTTDYNTLGKNHFIKYTLSDGKINGVEACLIKNGSIYCIKSGDFEAKKSQLLEIFGESACDVNSVSIICQTAEVRASVSTTSSNLTHVVTSDKKTACNVDAYLRSYCNNYG